MKKRLAVNIIYSLPPVLLLLISLECTGQKNNQSKNGLLNGASGSSNISLTDLQTEYIKSLYFEKIEAPKELINGKEYEPYYIRSKIKPLLFPEKPRTASLITKTRRYNNLTLEYDTFLDEVIYTDTSKTINFRFPQIVLNKDNLEGFNLYFKDDSILFRYLREPETTDYNLKEGFYEVAYRGKSRFLIKHESSFYVREGLNNYKYSPKFYISTKGGFRKVKSKGDLLSLFGEKSNTIKEYLHLARIKVRKADKTQIINILKYYDSLLTSE